MPPTSEITNSDVLTFLKENNYTIDVHRIPKGCRVLFPERILGDSGPKTVEYKMMVQKGQNRVKITKDGRVETLNVPNYASRIFIFFDIVEQCMRIGYHADFMQFFDGECLGTLDNITFNEFLKEGFGEEIRKKEEALWSLFTHSFNSGFPEEDLLMAENLALEEGYLTLFEMFHNGD